MKTRRQSKRVAEDPSGPHDSQPQVSRAVGSTVATGGSSKRATTRRASAKKLQQETNPSMGKPEEKVELSPTSKCKEKCNVKLTDGGGLEGCGIGNTAESTLKQEEDAGTIGHCDATQMDWEEGIVSNAERNGSYSHDLGKEVVVEFMDSPTSAEKKTSRRASPEEKELAELMHKVHLLCLLERGRIVDKACSDTLIQASILSLLPSNLLKITDDPKLTANKLVPLVNWFHCTFHVTTPSADRGSFESNLAFALQSHEGTAEEVAALSVALFRALNLTTRFVSVLDVVSLKPDSDISRTSKDETRLDTRAFPCTTTVTATNQVNAVSPTTPTGDATSNTPQGTPQRGMHMIKQRTLSLRTNLLKTPAACKLDDGTNPASGGKECTDDIPSASKNDQGPKRKGDLEFELQLQMAFSATAAGIQENNLNLKTDESTSNSPSCSAPSKKLKQSKAGERSKHDNSSTIWSRSTGPPLYWAEVYCSGETCTGRWVHVDAANDIMDGEEKVEAAAAVCRRPLRYVVAFAGNGAKDVTRRYCVQWFKIASKRINSQWWENVLAPLKELESNAIAGIAQLEAIQEKAASNIKKATVVLCPLGPDSENTSDAVNHAQAVNLAGEFREAPDPVILSTLKRPQVPGILCRSSLEDMELETRALTEPLPTNQVAYKNHHLYAIERWLTKYQTLHPKGPVLGYCSGHPVYPRSCVQTLQTRQKWLREGFQVRSNQVPAKMVKRTKRMVNIQSSESSIPEEDEGEPTFELYGKWQLEPLQLPRAVNGIVPKNERGQVEVWSEKCLPHGTVHLRLARVAPVARRLEIDYAPAMVGFEFRNGRSFPIFEGIVICAEFKDAILEAYAEEEERREAEERRKDESGALSRWYQLLTSITTRQRLKNSYLESSSARCPQESSNSQKNNDQRICDSRHSASELPATRQHEKPIKELKPALFLSPDHEHVFPIENQSFDEEVRVRTKRCPCGFAVQVEEL